PPVVRCSVGTGTSSTFTTKVGVGIGAATRVGGTGGGIGDERRPFFALVRRFAEAERDRSCLPGPFGSGGGVVTGTASGTGVGGGGSGSPSPSSRVRYERMLGSASGAAGDLSPAARNT